MCEGKRNNIIAASAVFVTSVFCMMVIGCSGTGTSYPVNRNRTFTVPVIQIKLPTLHEAVRKLPSGNWQVTYTPPYVPSEFFQEKYYI